MPSQKPRIATYTKPINVRKFKIVSAFNNTSMSDFMEFLIEKSITDYENEYGEIILKSEQESEENEEAKKVEAKNIIQNGDNNSINIG